MSVVWSLLRTLVTLAVAMTASGCIEWKRKDTVDQRSRAEAGDATPVAPPEDDPPVTNPEPVAPATSQPGKGRYALTQFICPDGKTENAKGDLFFVAGGDEARFEQALTPTCNVVQMVSRSGQGDAVTFEYGKTYCEGICGETCRKQLLQELGTKRAYTHAIRDGGFELAEAGTTIPSACKGQQPVAMRFAQRDPAACKKLWSVTGQTPADALLVLDGDLKWSTGPLAQGDVRTLSQEGLDGDFTITVRYADFATEDRGGYFRLSLESMTDGKSYAQATVASHSVARAAEPVLIAALGIDGTYAEDVNATVVPRAARDGELTIRRRGIELYVAAKDSGGNAAERTPDAGTAFGAGPYRMTLQLGNASFLTPAIPAVGISVRDVVVNDVRLNALPHSDRFECTSF